MKARFIDFGRPKLSPGSGVTYAFLWRRGVGQVAISLMTGGQV